MWLDGQRSGSIFIQDCASPAVVNLTTTNGCVQVTSGFTLLYNSLTNSLSSNSLFPANVSFTTRCGLINPCLALGAGSVTLSGRGFVGCANGLITAKAITLKAGGCGIGSCAAPVRLISNAVTACSVGSIHLCNTGVILWRQWRGYRPSPLQGLWSVLPPAGRARCPPCQSCVKLWEHQYTQSGTNISSSSAPSRRGRA